MDRLIFDYLPDIYKNSPFFKALMQTEQTEIERLFAKTISTFNNGYIESADEEGINRHEVILSLEPSFLSLEDRKLRLQAKYGGQLPYTIRKLEEMLEALCGDKGYKIRVSGNSVYTVLLPLYASGMRSAAETLLNEVMPANIVWSLDLLYNTWQTVTDNNLTWEVVKIKTWDNLRSESI